MHLFKALLLFAVVVALATPRVLSETVRANRSCSKARRVGIDRVDHTTWNGLLGRYVDDQGQVDYAAWQRSASDVATLDRYLNSLACAEPNLPATHQGRLAFWINAYNALTIRGILRVYPTTSIRNHTPAVLGYNIWKDLLLAVGGRWYSLEQIEHEVLRPMGDPRIHFAIVCASRGCPALKNEAFTPKRVGDQLQAGACAFFADGHKFRYEAPGGRMYLSRILQWFAGDFGADQAAMLDRIGSWLPGDAASRLLARPPKEIVYLDYDWNLNDQPRQTGERRKMSRRGTLHRVASRRPARMAIVRGGRR